MQMLFWYHTQTALRTKSQDNIYWTFYNDIKRKKVKLFELDRWNTTCNWLYRRKHKGKIRLWRDRKSGRTPQTFIFNACSEFSAAIRLVNTFAPAGMELASSSDVKVIDVCIKIWLWQPWRFRTGVRKISQHAVTGEKRRRKSQIVFKAFR